MHSSLKAILTLQEIDAQMIFLREAKAKRPRELESDRRALDEKKQALDRMAQDIKRLKMDSDRRELDLKKNEAEIIKLRTQLNQAKSNQEYQILKDQIARIEADNGKIEEDVLQRLADVEGFEQEKKTAESELKAIQGEFQKKVDEVSEIMRGIEEQLAALQARRQKAASDVPAEHLQLYERVLARHRDFALARVENQVCQGCFMSVTPQTMNLLLIDRDLHQCRNCLRILYLD